MRSTTVTISSALLGILALCVACAKPAPAVQEVRQGKNNSSMPAKLKAEVRLTLDSLNYALDHKDVATTKSFFHQPFLLQDAGFSDSIDNDHMDKILKYTFLHFPTIEWENAVPVSVDLSWDGSKAFVSSNIRTVMADNMRKDTIEFMSLELLVFSRDKGRWKVEQASYSRDITYFDYWKAVKATECDE